MRLEITAFVVVLILASPSIAQDVAGSATGALNGAVGHDHLRSSSGFEGRGAVRIPSQLHDRVRRDVGANFDARSDARLSSRQGSARLSGSLSADSESHLGIRNPPKKRPPDYRSKPPFDYKGREEGSVEVNRHVLHADLQLAHRLAEIDRLRDHALAHDDFDLMMRADVLEQQARVQHQQHVEQMRVAGQQGNGEKNGFRVDGEFDEDGANVRSHGAARGRAYPGRRTQYEAGSANYETSEPDEDAFENERDIPSDADLQSDARSDVSAERRRLRTRPRMPAPRETRVTAERDFEADFDSDYEAAVRPVESNN